MTAKQSLLLALADYVTAATQTQTVQARERVRQSAAELRRQVHGSEAAQAIEATNARLDRWRQNASLQPAAATGTLEDVFGSPPMMTQWFSGAPGVFDAPLEADDTRLVDQSKGGKI